MARPAVLSLILTNIFKHHHLLSVGELLELLPAESGKTYNKTSVYRALEKMETNGLICQHTFTSGETKYELRHNHHDHLVCSRCGAVQAANCQLNIPSQLDGFQTDHYHLTIFGICAECAAKS